MPKPLKSAGQAPRSSRTKVKRDEPVTIDKTRLEAVLKAAGSEGLLKAKTDRISGRVSPMLVKKAKKATGLETDTALIEFALANLALDDHFGDVLIKARGTVDPDLELGI